MKSMFAAGTIAGVLCLNCSAQQPAPAPNAPSQQTSPADLIAADKIATARVKLHAVEAARPGNTKELAEALNDLISVQRDTGLCDEETVADAKRLVEIEGAIAGPRSKEVVKALDAESDVLETLDHTPEGRAVAEQALEIAEQEFPHAVETSSAANAVGRICSWLGDFPCALRAFNISVDVAREIGGPDGRTLIAGLNNRGTMKERAGDVDGAIRDEEEAMTIVRRAFPNELHYAVIEMNLGTAYMRKQNFGLAREHTERAVDMDTRLYGEDSVRTKLIHSKLGDVYTRTGQFAPAWKSYEIALEVNQGQMDVRAANHAAFSQSLAQGGDVKRAVEEGLTAEQLSREIFALEARTLPERQALAYSAVRPHGLEVPLSVIVSHPELGADETYEEVIRSRALVADEMARRQRNLNRSNDPDTGRLLDELNKARADLLALEQASTGKPDSGEAIAAGTLRMENVERELAQRSAAVRNDEHLSTAGVKELRQALGANGALVSYVAFGRRAVGKADPAMQATPSYMAFVLLPDGDGGRYRIRVFDLGEAKPIDELVTRLRASADAEAHSGGLNARRNERTYREAGDLLRKLVWDPLKPALTGVKTAVVVPDGMLNLIPFAGLPDGKGYLVESGPVVRIVSSERDLLAGVADAHKQGMLVVGAPRFDLAQAAPSASPLRDASIPCDEFKRLEFPPLPGAREELNAIGASWKRWNGGEALATLTGADATREGFLDAATRNRVLHVATHAFVLDSKCGDGNPLLRSGLVFAGANLSRASAILTAQQIASLDLNGVDLAVLSACNTGSGELTDGEGVLGLERAFRIAGARSVVMTLWPVDDKVASRYMRALYGELLSQRTSSADAVWTVGRTALMSRRAAGQSTHPWYWAGFVASGSQ